MYLDATHIRSELVRTAREFSGLPLESSVLLTSIPKSGTHMLRNVLYYLFHDSFRSFDFVFYDNIEQIQEQIRASGKSGVTVGHVPCCAESCKHLRFFGKKVLLIRDPVDLLVAQSRAAFDPREQRADYTFVQQNFDIVEYMNFLVTGYTIAGVSVGAFWRGLSEFGVGWSTMDDFMVIDYSEVASPSMDVFLRLLRYLDVNVPSDFEARVRAGKDPRLSRSYLNPLSEADKEKARDAAVRLLKFHAPGASDWYLSTRHKMRERAVVG